MPITQEQFVETIRHDLARARNKVAWFKDRDIKEYTHLVHALQGSDDVFRAAAEELIFQQAVDILDKQNMTFEAFRVAVKNRLIDRARAGSRSTSDTSNLCFMYETAALAYVVSLFGE